MKIADALEAYKPNLEARFASLTKWTFRNLSEKFGPAMRNVANSTHYKSWASIRNMTIWADGEYVLSDAKIALRAEAFAEATIASWAAKIEAKLGELDNADVNHVDGCRFNIVGEKAGRKIQIEQDMIVNVSSKGLLFNQFPARIYVDGKFTSAAKYAAL